jgi:predicted Zn-dependent protease
MQGYSLGTQLGILLPYSRTQESEADHVGLILMAKAGYDPARALDFWRRMMTKDKGAKVPQFMSTHPNDATRLRELQEYLPEARKYYHPVQEAHSVPPYGEPALAHPAPVAGRWSPAPR